jgi:citrate synthase
MTEPAPDGPVFPTSIGSSTADTITVLGQDLANDLMGKVGFGELALWLVTQRRPAPGQVRVFEAVLVALADHGFTPTAIAARLTYLSAPESVQGAIAAGLLGGGSRFLGVTEDAARFLGETLAGEPEPADDAGYDELALAAVRRAREQGKFVPGLGHPVHKVTDPRTRVLLEIAEAEGLRGPHLRLFEAIGRVHPHVLGRSLPRIRLARQDGRTTRPPSRGAPPARRHGHVPEYRAPHEVPAPRPCQHVRERPWRPLPPSSHPPITPSTTARAHRPARTGRCSPMSGWPRSRVSARH